jgi:4-hydroxy-tetrahydrodipicolinate reductase
MLFLVLGRGKTGSLVAEVARDRGHSVRVVGEEENRNAAALTSPVLAGFDAVIDFTTPEAVVSNMRACLANGARMVVGTTGWYQHLDDMRALAARRGVGFLYGTNFSVGVQALLRVATALVKAAPHYQFRIIETHHADKKDAPSGTATTIRQVLQSANPALQIEIVSRREGDAAGVHVIEARTENDLIELKHEAFSRRGFAEGAVRAAEWIAGKTGVWEFSSIAGELS